MKLKFLGILVILIGATTASASTTAKRILIVGDSLTEGLGVAKENAFPYQMELLLKKKHPNVTVINAGSSGSTTASATGRLQWHLKIKPDILILALGANDGLRGQSVQSAKENLQKAITMAKQQKIAIYIAGMQMPMNYGEPYRTSFANIFKELAKENNIGLIPFLLQDVAGIKDLNQPDGIHPNEAGHKIMAKTVADAIEKDL